MNRWTRDRGRSAGGTSSRDAPGVLGSRSLLRYLLRPLLRGWLRLRVEGVEHVPAEGPVLIASTHRSHGDSVAIAAAVWRPVHILGDVKLTRWPVLGPQLPKLGMVPLRRGEADANALAGLDALLAGGACIAVYPEGSRSRDGDVHRLRSGVARLAADRQVPVVPATVCGTERRWPIGGRPKFTGGPVTVRFAPPVPPPQPTPRSRREFNMALQQTLAELAGVSAVDTFSTPHGGSPDDDPGSTVIS